MFVHDEKFPSPSATAEQRDGVVCKAVIQRTNHSRARESSKSVDDVNLAAQRREILAGGNVPIAVQPGAFLPARQIFQHPDDIPGLLNELSVTRAGMNRVSVSRFS